MDEKKKRKALGVMYYKGRVVEVLSYTQLYGREYADVRFENGTERTVISEYLRQSPRMALNSQDGKRE